MRSLEIALLELKRLFAVRAVRLAVSVICLVPLLYGVLYLWAFWNPYQRLDQLPVALVNNDRTVWVNGKATHAGDDLVRKLLKSDSFKWHYVSASESASGIASGRYYMSLTIPSDFSKKLSQASGPHSAQALLHIDSNEGSNLLATQIGSRIFLEIRDSAASVASKSYYEHVFVSFGNVHDQLKAAGTGSSKLTSALRTASGGASRLAGGSAAAASGSTQLIVGLDRLTSGTTQLASGSKKVAAGATQLAKGVAGAAGGASKVASGTRQLASSSQALAGGMAQLSSNASKLVASSTQLASGAAQVKAGIVQAGAQLSSAAPSAAQLAGGAGQLSALLSAYSAAHADTASDATFQAALAAAAQVKAGATQLSGGLAAAVPQLQQLESGAAQVGDGAAQLASGLGTYAAAVAQATGGAQSLASGAVTLSGGATGLSTGLASAKKGATALATAGRAVAQGAVSVDSGTRSAATGAATLSSGVKRLSNGSLSLLSGLQSIKGGSSKITTALRKGAVQVPKVSAIARTKRATVMSQPVGTTSTRVDPVPNYGTGFAPYFIPLALWVGALMTYFVVRAVNGRALASTLADHWVTSAGLWPAVAITSLQAIILLLVLHIGLGLRPVEPVALYLFTIVTAFTFTAIMQFLSAAFGTAGKFGAVVLLMLQLTSSAGTFPLQTVPGFFRAINPFLPMTYVVQGLRQSISGGDLVAVLANAGVLLGFAALAIGCTMLTVHRKRTWTMDRLYPALTL